MNSDFKIYGWYFQIVVLVNVKCKTTYIEIIFVYMYYTGF